MKIKLLLEYDGSRFRGWQTQRNLPTVQEELERSLEIFLSSQAKRRGVEITARRHITGSGRTDSGVHAKGQVASFQWPDALPFDRHTFLSAMNGIADTGVSVLDAQPAPERFNARSSPHVKCYSYRLIMRDNRTSLFREQAWQVPTTLNIPAMLHAARAITGVHDFRSFRAGDCSAKTTVRTVLLSELTRVSNEELLYVIHGKGFLKQMVRIIVGALVHIGRGRLPPDTITRMLTEHERPPGKRTAPARGLTLEWVDYDHPAAQLLESPLETQHEPPSDEEEPEEE